MAVKTCPKCGESNKETALQCLACSASLKDVRLEGTLDEEKQYSGLLSTSRAPSHCAKCGERLEPGAVRCKYCGTVVIKPPRTTPNYVYGGSSDGGPGGCALAMLFVATLIIPLVGLIVGGIFAFNDDEDKRSVGKGLLLFALVIIAIEIIIGLLV